jgi:N-acyl-D-aspartate/D-glutamate deacylase
MLEPSLSPVGPVPDRVEIEHDVVIRGGRVIDPESGLDGVRDVGIQGGRIVAVSTTALDGRREIDATGCVVSAGFIDLHSHAQAVAEQRLQASDGVTTALELESGVAPISAAYAAAAAEGRPINYGYSTSWAAMRMHVVAGQPLTGGRHGFQHGLGSDAWRSQATPRQTARMLDLLESELTDGAIGIGILLGYSPGTDPAEYVQVAQTAASRGVPAFTHARPLVEQDPAVVVDGAEEIARVAGETGAHLHFCHINSTSTRHLDRVHATVQRARSEGAAVTSEVYPYGAGMTGVGSDYFHPDRLHVLGATGTTRDVVYAQTGETVASVERLLEIRADDPSGLAFIASFDEHRFPDRVAELLALPGAVVASDAVPFTADAGHVHDPLAWPPPSFVRTHPRGAGTYARTLRVGVRESGVLTLMEALARCSLRPAQILEEAVPAMRRKGRIQVGCDADIVVFDPDRITDTATYRHSVTPSRGISHVIVNGIPVVRDGVLRLDVLPGLPVRATR